MELKLPDTTRMLLLNLMLGRLHHVAMQRSTLTEACPVTENAGAATAVCRDEQGNFLGSSTIVLPSVNGPAVLEAIACQEALALAANLSQQCLVLHATVSRESMTSRRELEGVIS